jgi:hypothetical protein
MDSTWITDEAYKFEFANYLQSNLKFDEQTDEEILNILINSQNIKYDKARGIQFIQKSGRETLSEFLQLSDISLFRQFKMQSFENIDWSNRSMSFTGLSAWLSSIFPDKFYPVPMKGLNETINYLFDTDLKTFPKTGEKYITHCQDFFKQTEMELRKFPIKEIHLKIWNKYFKENPDLNINQKSDFEQVDWNWMTQDLHLFIYRKVLNLYKPKGKYENEISIGEIDHEIEPVSIEGQSKLAIHMRYERDSSLIRKIKENAIIANPMLNCEVCGFSFFEKYGPLGQGFIEAHHKNPLSETKETKTTKDDIALVCSNCNKMIHKGISKLKGNTVLTLNELKNMLK